MVFLELHILKILKMGAILDIQMINQNNFENLLRQKQAKFRACFTIFMIVLLSAALVDRKRLDTKL